ncbi:MAG: hypothetical protein AUI16_29725 [Alphaproteobacteria bacterium 13_2_20CM_2_64_7]|jgi:hypothetical protein|nr:MAG: hypothetical protein AUI16_29725 [Alphaproteobacteria bacterium 13_2_20CM_2_64_7]
MSGRDKDATRAAKTNGRDPHRDIPKDANGDPIFFVMPDGVRASYERKLRQCEIGWLATDDPAFVTEAEILRHLHRQVSPLWLTEANIALNAKRRTKGHAKRAIEAHIRWKRYDAVRTAKEHGLRWLQDRAKRAIEHAAKAKKYAAELSGVRKAEHAAAKRKAEDAAEAATERARDAERRAEKIEKRGWVTWPEAYVLAAEVLAGTRAAGEPDTTIRKDYEQVKKDFKEGRGAMYLLPKLPRKTLTEALKAHD